MRFIKLKLIYIKCLSNYLFYLSQFNLILNHLLLINNISLFTSVPTFEVYIY